MCPECSGDSDGEGQVEDEEMQDAPLTTSQLSEAIAEDAHDSQPHEPEEEDYDRPPDTKLVLNEATTNVDKARSLRKRKTSSIELDDSVISMRKRRRNQSNEPASSHDESLDTGNSTETTRQQRTLRLKVSRPLPVIIEKRTRTSLVLKMKVKPGNLKEILSRRRRDKRQPTGSARTARTPRTAAAPRDNPPPIPISMLQTPFTTDSYSQPFYSFFDRETEDMKGKPYGGILTEAEADTSKTFPVPEDRRKFDQAKQKAEDEWRARVLAMQAEAEVPIRRPKKVNENASQIECIEFGGWEIDTWYAAPYPAEYSRNRVLFICEFCLKYMNSDYVAWRHKLKCPAKHPPGDEIYRHNSISVFEVDGRKNPVYCQNLCLLAKLFLGSKTLYYDVEPFLFYVLCEYDDCGYHFVGYFSKEKRSSSQNNVSCILTLPIHQRKGYGNLLIDFSYLLTKAEEKTGSPEKPLSDMGLVSYRNYWRLILCRYFLDMMDNEDYKKQGLSLKRISDDTGMTADDVISALEGLRALVRDPQTKLYAFRVDIDYCRQYVGKWEAKGYVKLKPEALAWTPYVTGRGNPANFELVPPLNAIAPREENEARIQEGPNTIGEESQPALNSAKLPESDSGVELKIEPTEGSEDILGETVGSIENVPPADEKTSSPAEEAPDSGVEDVLAWTRPYQNIPTTRFEVFPPVAGGRKSDRSRPGPGRPAVPRTASNSSSKRPKRVGGSSRRPTAARPKSASKRKSGGTGRGPGRWPKGTKKSDYGNADSGPGLPPGWSEPPVLPTPVTDDQDQDMAEVKVELEDLPVEDSVFVSTAVENNEQAVEEAVEEEIEEEIEDQKEEEIEGEIEKESEEESEEDDEGENEEENEEEGEEDAEGDVEEDVEENDEAAEEENDQDASGDEIELDDIIEEDVDAEGEDA